jgi:hypothetical protein
MVHQVFKEKKEKMDKFGIRLYKKTPDKIPNYINDIRYIATQPILIQLIEKFII